MQTYVEYAKLETRGVFPGKSLDLSEKIMHSAWEEDVSEDLINFKPL